MNIYRKLSPFLPGAYRVAVLGMLVLIYLKQVDTEDTADQARRHALEAQETAGYAHEAAKSARDELIAARFCAR
jgi:hypothetical protein